MIPRGAGIRFTRDASGFRGEPHPAHKRILRGEVGTYEAPSIDAGSHILRYASEFLVCAHECDFKVLT